MSEHTDLEYEQFVEQLHRKNGFDLTGYKTNQMNRRLRSFFDKRGLKSYAEFLVVLLQDKEVYEEFLNWVTINVTSFFRNPNRWEYMERSVLPLFAKESKIKCWSAACSTGEEPYTLAMLAHRLGILSRMDVLATDLDRQVLQTAKRGVYKGNVLEDVLPIYRDAYFEKKSQEIAVIDFIKQHIRFKEHNLLVDPYEGQFDLIICRNVMIYFTEEAKEMLYQKFYQALKPGGVLFTGSTEQIFHPERYGFSPMETSFYRKDGTRLTNEKKSL